VSLQIKSVSSYNFLVVLKKIWVIKGVLWPKEELQGHVGEECRAPRGIWHPQ
jgi:hypothetical protein